MPRKFDQDAKDRVVRLAKDRILAENISTQEVGKIVAPKAGRFVAHSEAMDAGRSTRNVKK